ncbi:MAG: replicative DNA helicase [Patescibacteria group bacterium]|nr:replicative DNA helicase [Patescibacteria group bacterium]
MIDSISEEAGAGGNFKRRKKAQVTTLIDRLPPHAAEAEQGVLGCELMSPNDCIPEVITKLKSTEAFYDLRHQLIQAELNAMSNDNMPVDVITLQQRLKDKGILEQCGGIAYLSQLQDAVPSAANLTYYLEFVVEKYLMRRMVQTCTEAVGRIYDYEGDVYTLMDEVEKDILAISATAESGQQPTKNDFLHAAIENIETAQQSNGEPTGLTTGYPDLDNLTDGLHNSEMIVIAARPSMGKTSLAMNIVEHVALHLHLPVAVFSLEMSGESLIERMLGSVARVNIRDYKHGMFVQEGAPKIVSAAGKIQNAPLYIDDTAGLSILQLRARARRLHQQHGIKLFVIDYLQLLHSSSPRSQDNRQIEITEISSGIKALAKELRVPVIVLSQLNREMERDKGRKPRLSDLRESGSIEQDADLVGLLYRPDDAQDPTTETESAAGTPIGLLIAKQRNGPAPEVVNLTFLKPFARFESQTQAQAAGIPVPYADN